MTSRSDLAKRAVACKHWRWMPGMLDEHGDRVLRVRDGTIATDSDADGNGGLHMQPVCAGVYPDLSDPATLGCLEHLVREAWKGCTVDIEQYPSGWWGVGVLGIESSNVVELEFRSGIPGVLAEALVGALEAAPDA